MGRAGPVPQMVPQRPWYEALESMPEQERMEFLGAWLSYALHVDVSLSSSLHVTICCHRFRNAL